MKTVVVPAWPSKESSTHLLLEAIHRTPGWQVHRSPDIEAVDDPGDVVGSLLVQPTALPSTGLPEPIVTVFNDRLARMPLPWVAEFYNRSKVVFSLNRPEPFPGIVEVSRFEWLPGAYSPEVHGLTPLPHDRRALGYIGTFNAWRKYRFLQSAADVAGLDVFGNAWPLAPGHFVSSCWRGPALYNDAYVQTLSQYRIAINVLESRWGPNRKCFEIPQQALMLVEWAPGVRDIFGEDFDDAPWHFETPADLQRCIRYFADNPSEIARNQLVQRRVVKPYTYDFQAAVIAAAFER